jgi:prepilin-type N-terminal cleavage/methylation domain-containing protein
MKYKHTKAFTMIELLVVISIIAILLVIILNSFNGHRKKARDNVRIADIQTIRLALDHYRLNCGEFPATLSLTANNGCNTGVSFGDFILEIPQSPEYAEGHMFFPSHGLDYFYAGLSNTVNGRCYEYHIATQLEYGADNSFADNEQGQFLGADHDYAYFAGSRYNQPCLGADEDFEDAEDDGHGLYDFRSAKYDD